MHRVLQLNYYWPCLVIREMNSCKSEYLNYDTLIYFESSGRSLDVVKTYFYRLIFTMREQDLVKVFLLLFNQTLTRP